jgi:DNA mismatch repair ATPase MutS
MAELLRLKDVVEGARLAQAEGGRVLYLLDEILHGTNTEERGLAARAMVRHLIASGAIGAVSTHDLALADTPDLRPAAQAVHFREEVGARAGAQHAATLTFDYLLRPGIATTRNALALLEAVGLGAPDRPTL